MKILQLSSENREKCFSVNHKTKIHEILVFNCEKKWNDFLRKTLTETAPYYLFVMTNIHNCCEKSNFFLSVFSELQNKYVTKYAFLTY